MGHSVRLNGRATRAFSLSQPQVAASSPKGGAFWLVRHGRASIARPYGYGQASPFPPAPCGCTTASKGPMRRFCGGNPLSQPQAAASSPKGGAFWFVRHERASIARPYGYGQASPFPPAPCGCTTTSKGPMRRFCGGTLPLLRKFRRSSATEPPRGAAAHASQKGAGGGPGGCAFSP